MCNQHHSRCTKRCAHAQWTSSVAQAGSYINTEVLRVSLAQLYKKITRNDEQYEDPYGSQRISLCNNEAPEADMSLRRVMWHDTSLRRVMWLDGLCADGSQAST